MAKKTLLEGDIRAGGQLIEALDHDGEVINAALWLYYPDLLQWKLLLVSPSFEKNGLIQSYTKISEILSNQKQVDISVADIKILLQSDPLMRLLKGIIHTGKGLNQIRMTSNMLNGIYVEDALIYRNA
ncbi:MAG TPA: hypothetical protein VGF07_12480 [Stellaceae bacterium]